MTRLRWLPWAAPLLGAAVLPAGAFAQPDADPPTVPVDAGIDDGTDAAVSSAGGFTVSGGATLASQYRYRGISLSSEQPAVQGTLNLSHDSGFYAGLWASSVDGGFRLGGADAEVDLYAGYAAPIASGIMLDGGLLYYAYPGSRDGDFDFFEPYASVTGALGPAKAKVGINYAWEQAALGGNSNVYVFADLSAGIPNRPFTVKAHLGFSKGDTPLTPGGDYFDWLVGAEFTRRNLTLGLAYVDTDLSASEATRGGADKDIVDAAIVASLSLSF